MRLRKFALIKRGEDYQAYELKGSKLMLPFYTMYNGESEPEDFVFFKNYLTKEQAIDELLKLGYVYIFKEYQEEDKIVWKNEDVVRPIQQ
jgi:hypothetical protein